MTSRDGAGGDGAGGDGTDTPAGRRLRDRLRRAGFAYLQRYSASEAQFRRVVARKLRRWGESEDLTIGEDEALVYIDGLVADFRRLGLVDDGIYAEGKAVSARAKGMSRARIAGALLAKGVDRDTAEEAIAAAGIDDFAAALRLCRRRRIGPWRCGEADGATAAREIAVLVRRGFAYGLARRAVVLAAEEAEERLAPAP